ncbi:SIR2 family protein [Herbaspirillum sp. C9C3]|uniref:SIR2 family protein n=1 Tax=Herbaspirillum sp. C9C3 TaxID=2735271 RepID=UPI001825A48B|nr:SIR2 family protein [Herbaspirillum sp. C9C3]NUT62800.1 SIR2 family protein [Herbaspirillum sp. C9C3]
MEVEIPTLSGTEFARAFALRPNLYAWFLGAGASAASGIPTGYAMIRDFKKRIFCEQNKYSPKEVDSGDPLWVARIDEFFKRSSILPPDGDPEEYSRAFEAVYPQEVHRRQYIDDAVKKGTPCFAHRVLASLMTSRQLDCVFTTNFDPLVEESVTLSDALLPAERRAKATVAAIDSVERAKRCLAESDWPLVAKLHGDYKSTRIKNTLGELQEQDAQMRQVLVGACQRYGLVVVGYSGRDASIMDALSHVLKEPAAYPGGLYWVTSSKSRLLPAVKELLEHAVIAGVSVAVVESKTFDELAGDLVGQVKLPDELRHHIDVQKVVERLVPVEKMTKEALQFPVLRCSAILVDSLPTEARRITLQRPLTTEEARAILRERRCRGVVAAIGNELAAFGRDADLLQAFSEYGPVVDGRIQLNPGKDSWALGLLYDSLTRALARRRPLIPRLRRFGHALLVANGRPEDSDEMKSRRLGQLQQLKAAYEGSLTGIVQEVGHPFNEGIHLKLEKIESRWWCGFEPFTFVDVPAEDREKIENSEGDGLGRPAARAPDASASWRRERWVKKYNKNWDAIIKAWTTLLTSASENSVAAIGLDDGDGIDAIFRLSPVTAWSRPSHYHPYFDRTK